MNYFSVQLDPEARISPTAGIVGDVRIAKDVTIFDGAQIRGDSGEPVIIGEGSNVQENCVIHVGWKNPTVVGKRVTVGHNAILHGCQIADDALIGMGAIVLEGVKVGHGAMVAAGALVTQNTVIPDGMVAMGTPAKIRREVTPEEYATLIVASTAEYINVGKEMEAQGLLFSGDAVAKHCRVALAK